jgi:hypothetical protein
LATTISAIFPPTGHLQGVSERGDAHGRGTKEGRRLLLYVPLPGRRYYFTIGNVREAQAHAKRVEVDETLARIDRGRLAVPEGVRLEDSFAASGKAPVLSARPETTTARQPVAPAEPMSMGTWRARGARSITSRSWVCH